MEDLVLSCLESRVEENRNLYARFLVGPFLRGDALTVATALRRVLLSSVESIGITALYIQGITHEFSTIVGVRESVLELSLNFGAIVLSYDKTFYQKKSFFDKLQIGYLQVQGPKVIYANHLKLPVGVKLVDPTQYIATISREGFIALKFVIGKKNTFFHPNIGSEAHFGDQAKNLSIAREICKKNIAVAKKTCSYRNGSTINSFFKTKSYESSDFAFIKKDHDKIEDLWFDKKKTARKSSNSFFTNLVVSSGNKSTRSSEQLPISDLQKNLYGMRKKAKHPILRRSSTAQTHNRLRVCISLTDKPGFCASKHIRTKLNSILFSSSKSLHFSKKADKVSRISTNQRFSGAKPQSLHTNLLANQRFALVRRRRRFFEISPIASARRFVSSRLSKRRQQEESIKYQKNNLTTTDPRLSFVDKYHASLSKVETPSLNHSDSGIFLIKIPEKRFQNKNENPLCQKYLSLHCLNHNRYNTFGAAFRFCRFDVSGKKYKQVILLSARSKLWFATLWIPSIVDPGYSFVRVLQKNTLDRSGLLVFDKSRSWQKKELCYKQEHNCLPLRFARNTQNLSQSRYKKKNICKKPFESKIRSSNSHKSTVLPFLRNELERKLYTRKNGIEQEKLNFLSNSDTFKSNICLRNVIPLDLNLTPVLKVNFVVEIDDEVLYLNQKLRERIILEVWTNGSIDPRQAVHDSALRLLDIFASFRSIYQVKGI